MSSKLNDREPASGVNTSRMIREQHRNIRRALWTKPVGQANRMAGLRRWTALGGRSGAGFTDSVDMADRLSSIRGTQIFRSVREISNPLQVIPGKGNSERFQRCLSRVRTASATDVMRLGLIRDLRKIRQDFSSAMPCSTGARDVASARLTVRCVGVNCPPGGRLRPVVTQGPAPW